MLVTYFNGFRSRFNIFISDFVRCSSILNFILYSDDSTLYFSSPSLQALFDIVNNKSQKFTNLAHTNKLTVNTRNSNYIIFRRKKNPNGKSLNIYLEKVFISREKMLNFKVYGEDVCKCMAIHFVFKSTNEHIHCEWVSQHENVFNTRSTGQESLSVPSVMLVFKGRPASAKRSRFIFLEER